MGMYNKFILVISNTANTASAVSFLLRHVRGEVIIRVIDMDERTVDVWHTL